MEVVADVRVVIAKIVSEGCKRREDLDDQASLFFSISFRNIEWVFFNSSTVRRRRIYYSPT